MSAYDEELQRDLEAGRTPKGEGLDVKAYQQVFRALNNDPGFEVSPSFARNVVDSLAKQRRTDQLDYFWFGAGIFFLIISSIATILFVKFRLEFGFLSAMVDYKELALFGLVFIVFLNWLDKRLVRKQFRY